MSELGLNVVFKETYNRNYLSILRFLLKKDGIQQGEIAKGLDVRIRSIAYRLVKLENCKFIIKQPDFSDLRSKRVFINPEKRNEIIKLLNSVF